MDAMASQITSPTIAYTTDYSGADQRKHKNWRHWPLWGNSPATGEFPAQRACNAENVSIWWRHRGKFWYAASNSELLADNILLTLF